MNFILLLIVLTLVSSDTPSFVLYNDITPANCSDSSQKIKNVPLKYYEFKYDSVPGRRQLGVMGADAQRWFPESVEIVPSYSIPSKDRSKPPIVLTNFPVVDKTVLFIHAIAALQHLLSITEDLEIQLIDLKTSDQQYHSIIEEIGNRLSTEISSQVFEKKRLAELESLLAQNETFLLIERAEKEKAILEAKLSEERNLLQYGESLAQDRMARTEERLRDQALQTQALEREIIILREDYQKETNEQLQLKEMELYNQLELKKSQFEKEKIKLELESRNQQERANEDIEIRNLQLKSKLETEKTVHIIQIVFQQLAQIVQGVLTRPQDLGIILGLVLGTLFSLFVLKEFIALIKELVLSRLGRPLLVRETSFKWSAKSLLFSLFPQIRSSQADITACFEDVILSPEDKQRIIQLALATKNTKQTLAPFRHVLFFGPPGTGKTLVARRLAEVSGMDYAIMSGGDVGPLGRDAVSQLHSLFRWASRSRRGLLLFIDEAEAFAASRTKSNESSSESGGGHLNHALNALLYQTGTQSRNFMLVLATNRPADLDSAVLDRMDISMFVGLPEYTERVQLIHLYSDINLRKKHHHQGIFGKSLPLEIEGDCLDQTSIERLATSTNGFSGREISKLFLSLRLSALLLGGKVTKELFNQTVDQKLKEHFQKSSGFKLTH